MQQQPLVLAMVVLTCGGHLIQGCPHFLLDSNSSEDNIGTHGQVLLEML